MCNIDVLMFYYTSGSFSIFKYTLSFHLPELGLIWFNISTIKGEVNQFIYIFIFLTMNVIFYQWCIGYKKNQWFTYKDDWKQLMSMYFFAAAYSEIKKNI